MYRSRRPPPRRRRLPLRVDYHGCADRQKPRKLADILIVDGNATGGPIDVADVQDRIVGAMNSHLAAFACPPRDFSAGPQFLEMSSVIGVGIIDLQKPVEAAAAMLLDNQIIAFRRAPIILHFLGPGPFAAPEYRVIALVQIVSVVDFQPMLMLENAHDPVRRIPARRIAVLFIFALAIGDSV